MKNHKPKVGDKVYLWVEGDTTIFSRTVSAIRKDCYYVKNPDNNSSNIKFEVGRVSSEVYPNTYYCFFSLKEMMEYRERRELESAVDWHRIDKDALSLETLKLIVRDLFYKNKRIELV